ncbi:MAG: TatD family hydrolase, partial [Saprospiraceae bacterium]
IDRLTELLAEKETPGVRGVFHCFTGNLEQAERIIELGFYLGLGGVLTYKNGGLDAVVPHLPAERLLLETDAPYLAPVPKRGKRNESAYVAYVAERLANLLGKEIKEIGELTTNNARQLFDLDGFTNRRTAYEAARTAKIG